MVLIFTKESAKGFITAGNKKYTFTIFPDKESDFSGLIKLDQRTKILLGDSFKKFLNENKFDDVVSFHDKFGEFIQKRQSKTEDIPKWLQNPLKTCAFIKIFQQELETSGEFIKDFDIENGTVEVEVEDSQLRKHKANLKLSQHYQIEPLHVISHNLPLQKTKLTETIFSHILSISEFCQKFSELLNHFQEFWNQMTLIDSHCYVLDPANPTLQDIHRTIKLTDNLSATLTLNPFFPREKPQMKLLGCYSDVNHYQDILQNNMEKEMWDHDEDLIYNMSNVLEIIIPSKMEVEVSGEMDLIEEGECAICFCRRSKDEIPSEVCENSKCRSTYHSTCLFRYLSSLPRNRDYFSKIQGECPNCSASITCSVPKFI